MSRTREAVRLIKAELAEMRGLLVAINSNLIGLKAALGEFHYDVEGTHERHDVEFQQTRRRLDNIETTGLPEVQRRVAELERVRRAAGGLAGR